MDTNVLTAGRDTRFQPLCEDEPKALPEVNWGLN